MARTSDILQRGFGTRRAQCHSRSTPDRYWRGHAASWSARGKLWLDAKRAPYKLSSDAEKWEIAKDVASFANSDRDAIILIGVTTEGTPNGDVLTAARPFHLLEMDVPARDRIVPLILDLDIGVVEVRDGFGYGWIRIPQQPSELKPFLVAGALVTAGFLGAHVAIPFRAVEDTAYLDAAAIHSFIAAGRASLRRGS